MHIAKGNPCFAEEETGLWTTATFSTGINEQWRAALALQSRFIDGTGTLNRLVIRPHISRALGSGRTLTLGYDAHFIEDPRDLLEQRLWQQFQKTWSIARAQMDLRVRLEERVIENARGVTVRPRFLVGVRCPLFGPNAFAIVRDEFSFNINTVSGGPEYGYDQNRFFMGIGGRLSDRVGGELGYQLQHVSRPTLEDLFVHQLFIALSIALD
jgi:hypothetical protein